MERLRHERLVADALADHATRRDGSVASDETRYAERLGPEAYGEFEALRSVERLLDDAMAPDAMVPDGLAASEAPATLRGMRILTAVLAVAAVVLLALAIRAWDSGESAPIDPESGIELARLERDLLGLDVPQRLHPRRPRTRGAADPSEYGLLPTGRVRPVDLSRAVFALPDDAAVEGRLVARDADGTVVAEAPFEPGPLEKRDMPVNVRDALASGRASVWGYESPEGTRYETQIEVLDADEVAAIDAELARLRERTKALPDAVRAWLEAALLLDRGLPTAAIRAAARAAQPAAGEDVSPLPWIQVREGLQRLDLLDSPLGAPVEASLDLLPAEPIRALLAERAK